MKNLSLTARVIAALAAIAITVGLLDAVFAIAEPQRSVLIAKVERERQPAPTRVALATPAVTGARILK